MLVNPMTFKQESGGGVGVPPLEIRTFDYSYNVPPTYGYEITNGILTVHTTTNALLLPDIWDISDGETWEMGSKVTLAEGTTNYNPIIGAGSSSGSYYATVPSLQYYNTPKHFTLCVPSGDTTWRYIIETEHTYEAGDTYYVRGGWDGSEFYIDVSTDGITWTRDATRVDSNPCYYHTTYRRLGLATVRGSDKFTAGTIDLTKTYIKINGVFVWGNA